MPFTTPRLTQLSLTNLRYGVNHGNTPMKRTVYFAFSLEKQGLANIKIRLYP